MFFDKIRITPQVKLDSKVVAPGDELEGTLYLTCTAQQPVTVDEVWVNFSGELSFTCEGASEYFERTRSGDTHSSSAISTQCESRSASWEDHEDGPQPRDSGEPSSKPSSKTSSESKNWHFGITRVPSRSDRNRSLERSERVCDSCGSQKPDSSESKRHLGVTRAPSRSDRNSSSGRSEKVFDSRGPHRRVTKNVVVALAQKEVPLRVQPSVFSAGVHALRFRLVVPREHNGQPLMPSCSTPELRLSCEYRVTAVLKLAPLLSRKASDVVHVTGEPSCTHAREWRATDLQRTVNVGTWLKDSTRWWPALQYYLGADTSVAKMPVTVHMSVSPILVGPNAYSYLHDVVRLSLSVEDADKEERFYVDHVRVGMCTTVLVRTDKNYSTTKHYTLHNARNVHYPLCFYPNTKRLDITALLSGARIPESVAPTVSIPNVHILHSLQVHVGLCRPSPDGTRQGVAHTDLEMEPRLYLGAPDSREWEFVS